MRACRHAIELLIVNFLDVASFVDGMNYFIATEYASLLTHHSNHPTPPFFLEWTLVA